ncbi:MAG TPA: hydrogenase iron-sulfur subunit [Dehalococcoidia bacterium]|nr:hydrogenase iron-sulfur subunit [Dehalococcoidia bacterium]
MSEDKTQQAVAVKQNIDYCSSCAVCSTLCPYEALKKDAETGKITLDVTKCQVCGLCYANCPARVIDTLYYDLDSLLNYLEQAKKEYASDTLTIMCRGSAPDIDGVSKLFGTPKFIPLLVPCVGRIPDEVYLKALLMGINKINVLACDVDYCRFERGSAVTGRKIIALNLLLDQLGYRRDTITLKRNSLKVKVDANLCIACGNCVFFCPYNAAELKSPGGITFDLDACRGCGLCVAMCPATALELENWEQERISQLISRFSSEMKSPKILTFRCQWASFPPLNGEPAPNIRFIDLPCASRVDRFHILEAFQKGVDGVMVAACSEDDCKQERASGKAQHSVATLSDRLEQIGFKERLHFCSVSPRYPEELDRELEQFSQKIKGLGKGG